MQTWANLRDDVEQVLQDTTNTLYTATEIDLNMADFLREIGPYSPYIVRESFTIESRTGTATSTTASALVDATNAQFLAADVGKEVYNSTDKTWAIITAYVSTSQVTLSNDIMASGENYSIFNEGCVNSKQLNISDVTDYMGIIKAQYPIGTDRNVIIDQTNPDIIELDINFTPTSSKVVSSGTQPDTEVYVFFKKRHKLSQLTDLAGTVSSSAGYSAGDTSMAIASLQATGTIEAEQEFTIANTRGLFHTTNSAAISGSAATIPFFPALPSAVANSTVITFKNSTLTPRLEPIFVSYVAGQTAVNKANTMYLQLNTAITTATNAATAIGTMAAKTTQAVTDIGSGRTETAKCAAIVTTANTELGKIGAQLTLAVADLASGRAESLKAVSVITTADTELDKIGAQITLAISAVAAGKTEVDKAPAIITTADTALDAIAARITQAIADTASGRGEAVKAVSMIAAADTALDTIAARITQSLTDLASARTAIAAGATAITVANTQSDLADAQVDLAVTAAAAGNALLNTVTVGGGAPEYMGQANTDLMISKGFVATSSPYLQEAQVDFVNANSDLGLANGEVNAGLGKLREAEGFLQEVSAENTTNASYQAIADREINEGIAKLREAQGFLQEATAEEGINASYLQLAAGDIRDATAYLQEAQGYFQEVQAELNINSSYVQGAIGEIRAAGGYLQEAQGYFQQVQTNTGINNAFLQDAAHQLQAANTDANEAITNLRLVASRIQIAQGGNLLVAWGNAKKAEAMAELRRIRGVRTSTEYART